MAETTILVRPAILPRPSTDPKLETWQRLVASRTAVFGLVVMAVLVLGAVFAPVLLPYDPIETSPDALGPPSLAHPFGTDNLGRDVLTRILHGGRISLPMSLVPVSISGTLGVLAGLLAGYYRGHTDTLLMRLVDMLLAFPSILLALAIVAILGPGLENVMIAVGLAGVPYYARVVRAAVLGVTSLTYIEAASAVGCGHPRILRLHVLPNVFAPILVMATVGTAYALLHAAALSFIGLGAQPPIPEWGAMLGSSRDYFRLAWWVSVFPGLAITLAVLAINLLGDGLRDALDPRLR